MNWKQKVTPGRWMEPNTIFLCLVTLCCFFVNLCSCTLSSYLPIDFSLVCKSSLYWRQLALCHILDFCWHGKCPQYNVKIKKKKTLGHKTTHIPWIQFQTYAFVFTMIRSFLWGHWSVGHSHVTNNTSGAVFRENRIHSFNKYLFCTNCICTSWLPGYVHS